MGISQLSPLFPIPVRMYLRAHRPTKGQERKRAENAMITDVQGLHLGSPHRRHSGAMKCGAMYHSKINEHLPGHIESEEYSKKLHANNLSHTLCNLNDGMCRGNEWFLQPGVQTPSSDYLFFLVQLTFFLQQTLNKFPRALCAPRSPQPPLEQQDREAGGRWQAAQEARVSHLVLQSTGSSANCVCLVSRSKREGLHLCPCYWLSLVPRSAAHPLAVGETREHKQHGH